MKVSWDDYYQYYITIKHVPNHQPVMHSTSNPRGCLPLSWCGGNGLFSFRKREHLTNPLPLRFQFNILKILVPGTSRPNFSVVPIWSHARSHMVQCHRPPHHRCLDQTWHHPWHHRGWVENPGSMELGLRQAYHLWLVEGKIRPPETPWLSMAFYHRKWGLNRLKLSLKPIHWCHWWDSL